MQKLAELEATAPKVTKKKLLTEGSVSSPGKSSFKDIVNVALSENVAPGQKPLPVLDPQKKQAGMGFVTSNNPSVQNMLKNLDPKDVQIMQAPGQPGQPQVGQQQQQQTGQPAQAGATGQQQMGQQRMQEESFSGGSKEDLAKEMYFVGSKIIGYENRSARVPENLWQQYNKLRATWEQSYGELDSKDIINDAFNLGEYAHWVKDVGAQQQAEAGDNLPYQVKQADGGKWVVFSTEFNKPWTEPKNDKNKAEILAAKLNSHSHSKPKAAAPAQPQQKSLMGRFADKAKQAVGMKEGATGQQQMGQQRMQEESFSGGSKEDLAKEMYFVGSKIIGYENRSARVPENLWQQYNKLRATWEQSYGELDSKDIINDAFNLGEYAHWVKDVGAQQQAEAGDNLPYQVKQADGGKWVVFSTEFNKPWTEPKNDKNKAEILAAKLNSHSHSKPKAAAPAQPQQKSLMGRFADKAKQAVGMKEGATGQPQQGQMQMKEKDSGQRYEVMLANGKTQRFVAATPEEAKKKAKGLGAKSLIKVTKDGMPKGKVDEEQLDELSPKTLGSYTKKASNDLVDRSADHAYMSEPGRSPQLHGKAMARNQAKGLNRQQGISRAVDKLSGNAKVPANEGAKVDRMVKHIEKSERGLGKSKEKASDIAWATANKRGMLDNKNKKKTNEASETMEYRVVGTYDAKTSKGYDTRPVSVKVKATSEKEAKELAKEKLAHNHKNYRPTKVEALTSNVKEADTPSSAGVDTRGAGRSKTTLEDKMKKVNEISKEKIHKYKERNLQDVADRMDNNEFFSRKQTNRMRGNYHADKKLGGTAKVPATEAKEDRDIGAEITELVRQKNQAKSPIARKNIEAKIATLKREKKKVNESMNHRITAARLEGKSHGIKGHAHCGKQFEDLEERKAYCEGYKDGLDELYEMGMYETAPPATVSGMADEEMLGELSFAMEDEFDEGIKDTLKKGALAAGAAATLGAGGMMAKGAYDYHKKDPAIGMSNYEMDRMAGRDFTKEDDMYEMDKTAYMKQQAIKTPGSTFKAFGQTMHDSDVLDEYAFESWDRQLNSLLNEGINVSVSKGNNNTPDSVSITATDADAEQLLGLVKNAGLGLFGADQEDPASTPMSTQPEGSPDEVGSGGVDISVVDGHDGMMGLMQKLSGISGGPDDYEDEEGHDDDGHDHEHLYGNSEEDSSDEEESNEDSCMECGGMMEAGHSCGGQMDEEETEDNAPDSDEAETSADEDAEAQEDKALAGADSKEEEIDESMKSLLEKLSKLSEDKDKKTLPTSYAKGSEEEKVAKEKDKMVANVLFGKKSKDKEKVDEWANQVGKGPGKGTDAQFTQDIDFMTKTISGGLNKPKSTGQTTVPVIAGQDERTNDSNINDWMKLAGIKK